MVTKLSSVAALLGVVGAIGAGFVQYGKVMAKIDELDNEIRNYKNDSDMLREKVDFANKRLEAQKLYYEDQIKKLSMD